MIMYNPVSTYRLQFNKDFTFQHAEDLVQYLCDLGIRTVYASPIFSAVPGSTHGYDVINPIVINPEIGTEDQLRNLIGKLSANGIGWIQDIVPNHMAYHVANPWVMDILEKGPLSPYAQVFDTTWAGDFHSGKPMAPFLGDTLEQVANNREIAIVHHQYKLCLHYGDLYFPLNSRSYGFVLAASDLPESVLQFVSQIEDLHRIEEPVQYAFRWHELMLQFAAVMQNMDISVRINQLLSDVSSDSERLLEIAGLQFYRLCHWRETDERINYRRFFLVNGLICLNMQSEKVFSLYHEQVVKYVKEGLFQGLRIDHIDGLFDPQSYLERLREACGPSCHITVEKILEHGEQLDSRWPVQGTTGYEFLSAVNNLFTRSSAENRFSKFYRSLNPEGDHISDRIRAKKRFILDHHMQGELSNLTNYFIEHLLPVSSGGMHNQQPFDATIIRRAIGSFMIGMPVYRYYGNQQPFDPGEQERIKALLSYCIESSNDEAPVLRYMMENLLGEISSSAHWLQFYQRLMQYTGPLMAKGVEDTLMYTFNRFIGHNEVGDSPEFFGLSVDEFHRFMIDRQLHWPLSLNATSTHDTKRGEDVRMRLNVLPDIADAWIAQVKTWMDQNDQLKIGHSPDANDEYFIYQNLVGIYSFAGENDLATRMREFMTKALREAKRHSNWAEPNEIYETSVMKFLDAILSSGEFMESFKRFCRIVADYGMINSLSQLTLKVTCPGVPDTYQGTADWDLSLVDPDNRRPVDFDKQKLQLSGRTDFHSAWQNRDDGTLKGWTMQRLLTIRNEFKSVFLEGLYVPLEVEGRRSENCLAFARQLGRQWILVAVPLNLARFTKSEDQWNLYWDDTEIILPTQMPGVGRNLLSGASIEDGRTIKLADVFSDFPTAVLLMEEKVGKREAGIVLHLSSLPGHYGAGDLGPAARKFVDFLHGSRQRIWQMLPITPPQRSAAYSPYSSYSSMAGSIMYISIDDLIADGLLDEASVTRMDQTSIADYDACIQIKSLLLQLAYDNFHKSRSAAMEHEFEEFVEKESYWLHDYALFEVIRLRYPGRPWYEWPEALRDRQPEELMTVEEDAVREMDLIMWSQYIFSRQWKKLRKYCHDRSIRLMGDLPFYVDRDSVDVWAYRDLFSVDSSGKQLATAGVPPDYFSADGQLWGMPVYNWQAMRENNYLWFVNRIRRNLSLFDMLRLDHFRAFASYWEVPAEALTAKDGTWKEGPGKELFDAVKRTCGECELIAEDLGEITPDVYELRNALQMPGMLVLQFAFGNDVATSPHTPHNHVVNGIVYTGTHDNNTVRGWFRKELSSDSRERLSRYSGKRVNASNAAQALIELAYRSVAQTAMIPMQDVLNLNERSRLNTPATVHRQNWRWRMTEIPGDEVSEHLSELTRLFGR